MKIGGWAPHELHRHEAEEVARDEAEGVRLAYVAATRARDLLVVPALGDEPWEGGWFSPLNARCIRRSRRGARPTAARSVRRSSRRTRCASRPNDEPAGPSTVCPGRHTFANGGYSVVWWEPGSGGGLTLDEKPRFGCAAKSSSSRTSPRNVIADGRCRYDRWKLTREDARQSGATPSVRVQTVREWAAESNGTRPAAIDAASVTVVSVGGGDASRRGGAAFGALVHAVLAQAPFDATPSELEQIATVEARVLGADEPEAAAAAEVVTRVFAHDLIDQARRASARGACRRETPVTLTLPDGTLVEGVVDLAFEQYGVWWVVDYKTDRDLAEAGEEQYRAQIALYAAAIGAATGSPVAGCLLRV